MLTEKRCVLGDHVLPANLEHFYPHKGGLSRSCRECKKNYERKRWAAGLKVNKPRPGRKWVLTPEQREAKAKRDAHWKKTRRAKHQQCVLNYLSTHPCVDCGEVDPVVLEFDHVRGEKVLGVSEMIARGKPWVAIEDEISKCDVRCVRCHRKRTARLGRHMKVRLLEAV